jgi:hypothetical protein
LIIFDVHFGAVRRPHLPGVRAEEVLQDGGPEVLQNPVFKVFRRRPPIFRRHPIFVGRLLLVPLLQVSQAQALHRLREQGHRELGGVRDQVDASKIYLILIY